MRKLVAVLIPVVLLCATTARAQEVVPRTPAERAAKHSAACAGGHDAAACGHGGCGCKGDGHSHGCCLLNWICYRRATDCCKGCGCCYYCHPPLYSYFLCDCRQGAHHETMPPKPCPPSCPSCGWGKVFDTGHRMFSSPAGQGVCGVR